MASRFAHALVVGPLGVLAVVHVARADETPLLVAGGAIESAGLTVAPIVALRVPFAETDRLTVSQIGWTSGARLDVAQSKNATWTSLVAVTPVRAHMSHDVFDADGNETPAAEFDDTALRVTTGESWAFPHFGVLARAVVGKEWVSGLPASVAQPFGVPFGGGEAAIIVELLRAEDPLDSRIDGLRATLRGEALIGNQAWGDADFALSMGRRLGPLFARFDADAFYVSLDNTVTDYLVGGSWDILGGSALVGHPIGAFRVQRGVAGTAGLDVQTVGPMEIGIRGSALAGTPVVHDGVALLALGRVEGVHFFVGAGSPDGGVFRGDLSKTSVFGGLTGAFFFLPP
jgi:hypothetical protein